MYEGLAFMFRCFGIAVVLFVVFYSFNEFVKIMAWSRNQDK